MAAGLFMPEDFASLPPTSPDPYASIPGVPRNDAGLGEMQALGDRLQGAPFTPPTNGGRRPPDIFVSPTSKQLYVQGHLFDTDDAQMALDTESLLAEPGTGQAPPGDWMPLDEAAYGQYLQSIKDPSMSRLAKKNFGRGADITQLLGSQLMQFAGAEETGQGIARNQLEQLRKTGPFDRQFTDIGSAENRGVIDWFVANLAQQGPNLIESVVTASLGALAGGAAGGGPNPVTAAGGALMSLVGKQSFKQSVLAAAKKHAAGEALNAAETKLLREAAGITAAAQLKSGVLYGGANGAMMTAEQLAPIVARQEAGLGAGIAAKAGLSQARYGGAALASLGQNYSMGVADVYGESMDSGDPDRATAAAMGIPYALLETMPEFLLAGRLFGNVGGRSTFFGTKPLAGMGAGGKAVELLKRGTAGGLVGGVSEGATEAGQEGLLLGVNDDVDWNSPEGMNRLVNSFAAGFGVGGPIGSLGGLKGTDPYNALRPGDTTEPVSPDEPIRPPNVGQPPAAPPTFNAPAVIPSGPAPQPTELLSGPTPGGLVPSPGGLPVGPTPGTILTGEGAIPTGPGTQGVLPLFDTMPADEMAQRMGGVPALPLALPPGTGAQPVSDAFTNPQQGALQYSGTPDFTPIGNLGNQLQAAFDAARRSQQVGEAQDQRRLGPEYDQALQQRELQDAGIAAAPTLADMPMREARQPMPGQMNLPLRTFRHGQPTGKGRLRRGTAAQPETAPVDLEPTGNVQLEMFSKEGKPTVAALKGAGRTRQVKSRLAGTSDVGGQIPPTGKNVNPLTVAAARKQEEAKASSDRGLKKQAGVLKKGKVNAVQERSPAAVDAREQASNGEGMGGEVPAPTKLAGTPARLRKGKGTEGKGEPDKQEAIVPPVAPPKEETPPPKPQAAAAVSAAAAAPAQTAPSKPSPAPVAKAQPSKADGPTPVAITMADGSVLRADGKKLLDRVDSDIKKFEALLACLTGK
jgi:hypothetical protein